MDSIACKREGDGSIADQRLTNQLLIELDKIFLAQSEMFVIAATNLPWQVDLAVMRRFPHTVYIELPNAVSRSHMFRSLFGADVYSDNNIATLVQLSDTTDTPWGDTNNGSSVLVVRTLEQIVTEYGESCIVMPVVDFENISGKVEAF